MVESLFFRQIGVGSSSYELGGEERRGISLGKQGGERGRGGGGGWKGSCWEHERLDAEAFEDSTRVLEGV